MDESAYRLPYVPKGAWLEERYVRCGRRCRCREGEGHGTYWRLCWREGKRRRQRYVAAEDVPAYAMALERRRRRRREYLGWREYSRYIVRTAKRHLRETAEFASRRAGR